ncbi:polyprotein 1 [Red clover torradovirus 1]|nr:polyprotein 1 [Red clover torradovirus 1]
MFSTLRSIATKATATGNNVHDTAEKANHLMDRLTMLEGPFSNVVLNSSEITDTLKDDILPEVAESSKNIKESTSVLQGIFKSLEAIIQPLLATQSYILSAWRCVTDLLFSMFKKITHGGSCLLQFLTEAIPEDLTVPIAAIVFFCALALLKYILPSNLIEKFISFITNAISIVKGFVLGLLPKRMVDWFASYFTFSQKEILQAHAPGTFGSDTAGFSFSDALISLVSMGFVSLLYSYIGMDKPGRNNGNPISRILCSVGDHASKMNHLFTFFRNVKTSLTDTMIWVGEWMCEMTGFASPLTATINSVLNTELFQWFNEVNSATDPAKRLENFSNPNFNSEAALLKDKAKYFEAEFAKYPISPFVAGRFSSAISKLDKLLEASYAHKGVGQFRTEPYCLQLYGEPGCGKTMSIGFIIEDLLNRLNEPKTNRLYSLSSKDGYWSNYNHQTAVLIDDFGQVLDSAKQHEDVKDFIFMKSSAPMSLSMAAVEEKGTQFTSKYIFLTSNFASPSETAGVMDLGAVQRRRNLLVEVTRVGPIDQTCRTPVDNVRFTVRASLAPHRIDEAYRDLTYAQLLDVVEMNCKQHWEKDSWLKKYSGGIESLEPLCAQKPEQLDTLPLVAQGPNIEEPNASLTMADYQLSSFKYAYAGVLNHDNPFVEGSLCYTHFSVAPAEVRKEFGLWRSDLLAKGITDVEVPFWREQMVDKTKQNLMAWLSFYTFNEAKYQERLSKGLGTIQMCVESDDIDALTMFEQSPERTKFAYALILRQFHALRIKAETSKPKDSFVKQVMDYIKRTWDELPGFLRTIIKIYAMYQCSALLFQGLSAFIPAKIAEPMVHVVGATVLEAAAPSGHGNISGDEATHKGSRQTRNSKFLTAQLALSTDWAEWAIKDPFLKDALINNAVLLQLNSAGVFRGVYVKAGWIATVAHPFVHMRDGTGFTLIHRHSKIAISLDKRPKYCKFLPSRDIVLLYVGDVDGVKKDITNHFSPKKGTLCAVGSKGVLFKPYFQAEISGELLSHELIGVSMTTNGVGPITYSDDSFKIECVSAFSYHLASQNGDCGSLLLLPAIGNRQPVICGIHCAGVSAKYINEGFVSANATAIYREDLIELCGPNMLVAQGPCSLLSQLRKATENPFEIKQVALMGSVPTELAINVPHKTTLRKSELFEILEEKLGKHSTEPSILIPGDRRTGDIEFDPYTSGVAKFNETAQCFNMEVAEEVMEYMSSELLDKLKTVSVPGGRPVIREEDVILNGIPGEKFYDSMDMSTACGYPFTLSEFGKNKRGYIDGEPGEYVLHRDRPVYPEYCELDNQVRQGIVSDMVTCECAKDERLPLEKIYEKPKTRLFTILPFHYNMLVRKYFLDFSATLMRAHNIISCKVGINPEGVEWTTLARGFLEVSGKGFSADYSSFDGRAPVFVFQWFCDLVDKFYGDKPGSENSLARHALLMMASCHYTLCGDKLYRVVGGMPSGFSLTVLFNSLLNEFYMRYAFQMLLKNPAHRARTLGMSQRTFSELFVAIYGDDNLVAVPIHLQWYSLPNIASELSKINVVIKNGLDKSMDVSTVQFQSLGELTFLSRGFLRHELGYFRAPLKWVSIIEPLRWIRPTPDCPAVLSLLQNVHGSLRAAYMHGKTAFEGLRSLLLDVLNERKLPSHDLPHYGELEREWIADVTGTPSAVLESVCENPIHELEDVTRPSDDDILKSVNTFVPGIYFCSARTAKRTEKGRYVFVNCMVANHPSWIRGPESWKDLENKIWAYTMSAIESKQCERVKAGQPTDLLFVCPGGIGMSVVCAALAALASAQYTKAQIVTRLRQISGSDKLSSFAGGAGQYVILAAQQGSLSRTSQGSSPLYGSNIYDRCIRVGNCCIVSGVTPPGIPPGIYSCTPVAGFGGVKTSRHYINKQDPFGSQLAKVIRQSKNDNQTLFLFFTAFKNVDAEWVLNGLKKSGVEMENVLSNDLVLLERQAKLVENAIYGKIHVEVSYSMFGAQKMNVVQIPVEEMLNGTFTGHTKALPLDSLAFRTPTILKEKLRDIPAGKYYVSTVLEAVKLEIVQLDSKSNSFIPRLEDIVDKFYPTPDLVARADLIISLELWMPDAERSNFAWCTIPEAMVYHWNEEMNYVSLKTKGTKWVNDHLFLSLVTEDFNNGVESLNLQLFSFYNHDHEKGRKTFTFYPQLQLSMFLIIGLTLENEIRKKKKEALLELPHWFPMDHKMVNIMKYANLSYVD